MLNLEQEYRRYAEKGNLVAIEFQNVIQNTDEGEYKVWNLWENLGIYNYYMMFTWQGYLSYLV